MNVSFKYMGHNDGRFLSSNLCNIDSKRMRFQRRRCVYSGYKMTFFRFFLNEDAIKTPRRQTGFKGFLAGSVNKY